MSRSFRDTLKATAPRGIDAPRVRTAAEACAAAQPTPHVSTLSQLRQAHEARRSRSWWYRRQRRRWWRDPTTIQFETNPPRGPRCADCPGNCCLAPNLVSLRLIDVALLLDAGLGWAITWLGRDTAPTLDASHRVLELEGTGTVAQFPVLRSRLDDACVFLSADNQCTIYAIRPLTCRRYPWVLRADGRAGCSTLCPATGPLRAAETITAYQHAVADCANERHRDLDLLRHHTGAWPKDWIEAIVPPSRRPR